MGKDELHELYTKMQAEKIMEEAEETSSIDNFPKSKLIQILLVMTKFSDKFLKLQDEETLKMLVKSFMAFDKTKMKKDLGISNLLKPTESNE